MIDRRTFISSLAALGGLSAASPMSPAFAGKLKEPPAAKMKLGEASPFTSQTVIDKAKQLSQSDYQAPVKIPKEWINLTYDQYKGINFNHKSALWGDTNKPYWLEFFAPGLYFPSPIAISVFQGDEARPVLFSKDVFRLAHLVPDLPVDETLGYSGFRVRTTINDPERRDEFVVFQGASYFRAVGRGHIYGLSARGLALNTADPAGEEFPDFREFWVEENNSGSHSITIHALMDSPSVTGAYRFTITPGTHTEMDVEAVLFPRIDLKHVGIGAETSMFLFDETNRNRFDDFRPAVHDTDGLLIENGAGETLWRQLANPLRLQVSSFVDDNPKGFGLLQRPRKFADYADLEARYHKRPGLWVVPGENWGRGSVTLVEIPADREIYDNIVAYWRPRESLLAGKEHRFSYRLYWCDEPPVLSKMPKVINTRMGKRFSGGRLVTIDFTRTDMLPKDIEKIGNHVGSNGARVTEGILQENPETGGIRLAFTFYPKNRRAVELRAQLRYKDRMASEVWLYRWTA